MDKNGADGSVKRGLWIILLLLLLILLPFVGDVLAENGGAQAEAGPDQVVFESDTVLLDGSGSVGEIISWSQIGEISVELTTPNNITTTFIAPEVTLEDPVPLPLTFEIYVYNSPLDYDTDQVIINVGDKQRVLTQTLYLDQYYGISVAPGNLIGFGVTGTGAITNTVTGIVPNIWNGAIFDTVISGTTSSTVTLFFDNPVPPGYDLWRLSRSQSEWLDLSGYSNFNPGGTAVSWTLTDNDPLFDDNPVTGTISDPAAMARVSGGGTPVVDSDGGCFIGTVANGPGR
jgi:hypothetical protein